MAINLKKESYSENNGNSSTVRTVYPEKTAEEIYPQREIFPQRESYPRSGPQENAGGYVQEEIYPNTPLRAETAAQALPQARTLPPQPPEVYNNFPKPAKRQKRKKKKHLLTTLIVLCVALTAVGKGMQEYFESRGYLFDFFSDSSFSERTVNIAAENISSLQITDSNSKISVVPSNDSNFHITVSENSEKQYSITAENGAGVISGDKYFALMSVSGSSSVTVEVPAGFEGKIKVDSSNSRVECSAGSVLDIDNSNGKVTVENIENAESITVQSSNSTISAENISAETLSLTNSNGRIEVENAVISGETVLDSDNSGIDVSGTVFGSSGKLTSDNGSVKVSDSILGNNMIISSENGSVNLYDLSFEDLLVKARNGSIKGSVYGDPVLYTITAEAQNGSSDIESGGSGKYKLDLNSRNGSIRFDFDGSRPAV